MAIAFVQSVQAGTSGGSTSTIGFSAASTAGNTLILSVSSSTGNQTVGGASYTSVSSNVSGTTFVKILSSSINHGDGFYEESQIWAAYNVPAGLHSVTVNCGVGSNDYGQLFLSEFSGLVNVSVVDVTGSKTGDTTLGQFDTTINAGTTTQANELIIAAFSAGGATNLSNYFTTGIVTPAGFTSIGYDPNARLGNRALSHSYRIANTTGAQNVSWGTIADPGAGEKLVWAANVASLKAQVAGLNIPGNTFSATSTFNLGSPTAVRRAVPSGQIVSAASSIISGVAQGRINAVARMANSFTFDSSGQPTFDQTSGTTFDNDGTSVNLFFSSAVFSAGAITGLPTNQTGVNLVASSSLSSGTSVAQRKSALAASLVSATTSLSAGTANARRLAAPSSVTLNATASFISGQNLGLLNTSINGVSFAAITSIGNQQLTYTFDSTNQPTFDNDSGYTFDSAPVSAGQSAVPFGAIFGRQSSLLSGAVSATRLGTAGNILLPVVSTVLVSTASVVAVGAIPGVILTAPASFLAGNPLPQLSVPASGITRVGTSSLIAGTATSKVNGTIAGTIFTANASVSVGTTSSQISKAAAGSLIITQSSLNAGTTSTATSVSTPSAIILATSAFTAGNAAAKKNANVGSVVFSSYSEIRYAFAQSGQGAVTEAVVLNAVTIITAGSVTATKISAPVGRLLTTSSFLISGGINGLKNGSVSGEVLLAGASYASSSPSSTQAVQRPSQTFLVRPELLAGQVTPTVNANVNPQMLAATSSMAAGNIVYFAAVNSISQNVAAQSAFFAGAAVGKQLSRRNTGGKAFNFLQEFLQPIVGQELIFSNQNGPRPAKPYATLAVRSISEQPIIEHDLNGDGIVSLAKLQRMIVEVEYFGFGAFSKAQILGLKLQSPRNVDRGQEFGISVSELRGVTRVPELLNQSQYEERGILEFTAYIMVEGDDDVGLIEHAIIQDTDADHACVFDFPHKGPN